MVISASDITLDTTLMSHFQNVKMPTSMLLVSADKRKRLMEGGNLRTENSTKNQSVACIRPADVNCLFIDPQGVE